MSDSGDGMGTETQDAAQQATACTCTSLINKLRVTKPPLPSLKARHSVRSTPPSMWIIEPVV